MNILKPPVNYRDHIQGPSDAAVVLVEFGDYECSHCKAAYPAVKAIQRELEDQLCFVYRHFPLVEIHRHALMAAEAAEAAGAQGRFWQMHNMLFRNSPELTSEDVLSYAVDIGLHVQEFVESVRAGQHLPRVEQDVESAVSSGARGTPTFFINGVRHEGGYDLASLREALHVAQ